MSTPERRQRFLGEAVIPLPRVARHPGLRHWRRRLALLLRVSRPGLVQLKGKVHDYPGLDIKADGGYVVAPPSRHFSGGTYRWQKDDWRTTAIAPVPEWLLELVRVEEKTAGRLKKPFTRGWEALDCHMQR